MSTMTVTLTDFLLARIAEDEAAANHARWAMQGEWFTTADDKVDEFVQHNSPDRVLAECDAKRRIVELHQRAELRVETENRRVMAGGYPDERGRVGGWDVSALRPVLRLLALPYADHPDYRQEFRP